MKKLAIALLLGATAATAACAPCPPADPGLEYPATTVPLDVPPGEPGSYEWCIALDYPNNYCLNLGWVP